MTKFIFTLSALAILQTASIQAQKETAHHREVYAQINEDAASYKKIHKEMDEEHGELELTGWSDNKNLRKIVATIRSDHGSGTEEYYIENGKLLFLFSVYTTEELESGKVVGRHEDRYYFKGDGMIKWLSGKEEPFEPGSRDFRQVEDSVLTDFARYKQALGGEPAAEHATGKFTGIEEGDYFHWNMTGENGADLSFFILDGGESVDRVLEKSRIFIGRKCRISYKTSMEEIPEAGGKVEISQITGVEWFE